MSTKTHIICEDGIEIYHETSQPRDIFGKFTGFDVYIIIEKEVLKSFVVVNSHIEIVTNTPHFPNNARIWGDAVERVDWNGDDLFIQLRGGHYITRFVENKEFDKLI